MPMLPRVVTSPPTVGAAYNSEAGYNAALTYNQAISVGATLPRTVAMPAAAPRSLATASMKGR